MHKNKDFLVLIIILGLAILTFFLAKCLAGTIYAQEPDIKTTAVCVNEPHKFVSENGAELYKCQNLYGEPTDLMVEKPEVLTLEEAGLWAPTPTPEPLRAIDVITQNPLVGIGIAILGLIFVFGFARLRRYGKEDEND